MNKHTCMASRPTFHAPSALVWLPKDFLDPAHKFFYTGWDIFLLGNSKITGFAGGTCREVVLFDVFAIKRGGTLHLTCLLGACG